MHGFAQKSFRVLIVDDANDIHQYLRKLLSWTPAPKSALEDLESALFEDESTVQKEPVPQLPRLRVDSAFHGSQAIEMVQKAAREQDPYQLIFMDVRMPPGIDGIQATQEIWKIQPDVNVVICSAYSDYSIDAIINKLEASDRMLFLTKPFPAAVLKQSAVMMLRKWDIDHILQAHAKNLEALVDERTKMLVHSSKMAALGEMAGGIAHEINTPLAVIKLVGEQVEQSLKDDIDKDFLISSAQTVVSTVDRISRIINGLRAFSRDRKGDPFRPVSIHQIIGDTLQFCHEKFRNENIRIELKNDLRIEVACRSAEISQVLLSLLYNAYDAIQPLAEKWIRIELEEKNGYVVLSVTDSGSGVPQEIRDKIMQPFFTTKQIGSGPGLGLSVSKGIIEAHGGRIYLDATSKNTRFLVELPVFRARGKRAA